MQNILHRTKTNTVLIADHFTDTNITHVMTFFRTSTGIQAGLTCKAFNLYIEDAQIMSVPLLHSLHLSLETRVFAYWSLQISSCTHLFLSWRNHL